jgi:hypothetical protein
VDPVGPAVHVVHLGQVTLGERLAFGLPWLVSRVITEADRPAAEPNSSSNAGTKSLELSPCGYSSGST